MQEEDCDEEGKDEDRSNDSRTRYIRHSLTEQSRPIRGKELLALVHQGFIQMSEIVDGDLEREFEMGNQIRDLNKAVFNLDKKVRPLASDRGNHQCHECDKSADESQKRGKDS